MFTGSLSYRIVRGACMSQTVTGFEVHDIRFPTSEQLDGSDAMNPTPTTPPPTSCMRTDAGDGGARLLLHHRPRQRCHGRRHRGTASLCQSAGPRPATAADLAALHLELTHDSQLRWLGPEKGVMHMAVGAVVNAAWDLAAEAGRAAGVGVPRRHVARGARLPRRLPLPHRRTDPRRGTRHPARRRAGPGRTGRAAARATAIPPTPPRRAGSATPTTNSSGWPSRPSPTGSGRSS